MHVKRGVHPPKDWARSNVRIGPVTEVEISRRRPASEQVINRASEAGEAIAEGEHSRSGRPRHRRDRADRTQYAEKLSQQLDVLAASVLAAVFNNLGRVVLLDVGSMPSEG